MELKALSEICDAYQRARETRLFQEKLAAKTKEAELLLRSRILGTLRDHEIPTIGGATHNFERVVKEEPQADDWDLVHEHVVQSQEWDLIRRRLGTAAVKERWDVGVEVPGVGRFPVEKLSVTKHR